MTFVIEPAIPVKFRVRDLKGLPAVASFTIRDAQGRIHPMQSKRLEPDFFSKLKSTARMAKSCRCPPGNTRSLVRAARNLCPKIKL